MILPLLSKLSAAVLPLNICFKVIIVISQGKRVSTIWSLYKVLPVFPLHPLTSSTTKAEKMNETVPPSSPRLIESINFMALRSVPARKWWWFCGSTTPSPILQSSSIAMTSMSSSLIWRLERINCTALLGLSTDRQNSTNPFLCGSFAELYNNDEARTLAGVERDSISSGIAPSPLLKLMKIALIAPTKLGSWWIRLNSACKQKS